MSPAPREASPQPDQAGPPWIMPEACPWVQEGLPRESPSSLAPLSSLMQALWVPVSPRPALGIPQEQGGHQEDKGQDQRGKLRAQKCPSATPAHTVAGAAHLGTHTSQARKGDPVGLV